ncbi:TPA: hypothetical protein ACH3X1_009389 [Trebouxia sp. C0004]
MPTTAVLSASGPDKLCCQPENQLASAVSRLHLRFPKYPDSIIQDILEQLGLDEEAAGQHLADMSGDSLSRSPDMLQCPEYSLCFKENEPDSRNYQVEQLPSAAGWEQLDSALQSWQSGDDINKASNNCLAEWQSEKYVTETDWSDSSPESDYDSSSVAAESLPEVDLPLRAPKSRFYRPDCPQILLFEDKFAKLKEQFSELSHAEISQMLTATDGIYDSAYALLHQRMGLQEQVDDNGWLVAQDPTMRAKLVKLRQWYPNIDIDTLQNVLAAHEGCMHQTKQCLSSHLADTSAPVTPTRKAQSRAFRRAPPTGSLLDPSSGRPNTTPPGFGFPTPAHASAGASASASSRQQRRSIKTGHTDLYTEARQKSREAQAQIATCKQGFHTAVRAGDHRKQQMYTSQIEHWQHVAVEEKQRAQKTIFSRKNADISNMYKLDLRALRVEQALEQIQKTINDLSSFKCKSLTAQPCSVTQICIMHCPRLVQIMMSQLCNSNT